MPKKVHFFTSIKKVGEYPNAYVEQPDDIGKIDVVLVSGVDEVATRVRLDRHFARMLARRINQFLDGSK